MSLAKLMLLQKKDVFGNGIPQFLHKCMNVIAKAFASAENPSFSYGIPILLHKCANVIGKVYISAERVSCGNAFQQFVQEYWNVIAKANPSTENVSFTDDIPVFLCKSVKVIGETNMLRSTCRKTTKPIQPTKTMFWNCNLHISAEISVVPMTFAHLSRNIGMLLLNLFFPQSYWL
jgi:hypothetical protein